MTTFDGTPITPADAQLLSIYADLLNLNPFTFFGVNHTPAVYKSTALWTFAERQQVLFAMKISRLEMEQQLGYFLLPTYTSESHPHQHTLRLNHAFVTSLGTPVTTDLDPVVPDYNTEPATVVITTTTPDDIHLFYPDTDIEIFPSARAYVGETLTLRIPRYALRYDDNNPAEGWTYSNLDNFLDLVDVKSITVDSTLALPTGYTPYLVNAKMGILKLEHTLSAIPFCNPASVTDAITVNYSSGLTSQDFMLRSTWVAFAHAKMDIQPSEDPAVKLSWLWARDIPKEQTSLQKECPFGQFAGAFQAWRYVSLNRLHRATPL
jgi:hypothetical protein